MTDMDGDPGPAGPSRQQRQGGAVPSREQREKVPTRPGILLEGKRELVTLDFILYFTSKTLFLCRKINLTPSSSF